MPLLPKNELAKMHREAIQRFMQARDLTVATWTAKAGLPDSTLRNFITGDSKALTSGTLANLAKAVGVSISEILGEKDVVASESEDVKGVNIQLYRKINEIALDIVGENEHLDKEEFFSFIKRLYDVAEKKGVPPTKEVVDWMYEDTFVPPKIL